MDADKNMYHLKETKKEKKLVVIGKGGGEQETAGAVFSSVTVNGLKTSTT